MDNGLHGNAGCDHGVCDACLPEHNANANGQARDRKYRSTNGRTPRILSDARVVAQPNEDQDKPQRVRLGRGDPGTCAVSLLLRLHTHALARRRAVPKIRGQAHDGHRYTVHRFVYADHSVRC